VRFLAATNRELEAEIERGAFRKDLFFRLAGAVLRVPPLRNRQAELLTFAQRFLEEACAANGSPVPELSPGALAALKEHTWPGNLRELRNTMERAALLSGGEPLRAEHVAPAVTGTFTAGGEGDERQRLGEARERFAGHQSSAARFLGIARSTLIARIKKHGLARPRSAGGMEH
jgi:DNA-binding NtrC family response regulator